jgi:hypothetical protein
MTWQNTGHEVFSRTPMTLGVPLNHLGDEVDLGQVVVNK